MHLRIVGLVIALISVIAIFEVRPGAPRLSRPPALMHFANARAASSPAVNPSGPVLSALPIDGLAAKDLHDSFAELRGLSRHEAIDIMEPRGTPVRAVADGTIARLFLSKAGGNTIYLFDNGPVYCYYYAHLDRYADGLQEGQRVSAGDVIGYVGSTGNASATAPHLHFTIFELGPEKRWWKGTVLNPYPVLMRMVR
ncbi:MAG TPA: M23 family metallopeptidase [Bryobacteraceae bacterium]|nr:M23 family metallopeptidase [Bryobacteraceae bacterium]